MIDEPAFTVNPCSDYYVSNSEKNMAKKGLSL